MAVSNASKIKYKQFKSAHDKELELLCTAIDDNTFGNALVDCVLVEPLSE